MTKIITLTNALEALDELDASAIGDEPYNHYAAQVVRVYIEQEFALKISNEQAEQEPVAYRIPSAAIGRWNYVNNIDGEEERFKSAWQPLYAAPVRTKDLTGEEIERILTEQPNGEHLNLHWFYNAARAVIAADREKNK